MSHKYLDEIVMRLARSRLKQPKAGGQRVAAAVVSHSGVILGQGVNSYKTHPVMARAQQTDWGGYLHAEVAALVKAELHTGYWAYAAGSAPEDVTLVVARVVQTPNKVWMLADAEPCRYCKKVIVEFGVKNVWWSKGGVKVT